MLTQRSYHPLPQQGAANGHRVDYQQPQHQFCCHRRQVQAITWSLKMTMTRQWYR